MSRTSTPPICTLPLSTSQNRGIRAAAVDLPPPEGPTRPTTAPSGTVKDTWSNAGRAAPGYRKVTSVKVMVWPRGRLGAAALGRGWLLRISSIFITASSASMTDSEAYMIRLIMPPQAGANRA